MAEGQFAPGLMLPKVEAAVKFAEIQARPHGPDHPTGKGPRRHRRQDRHRHPSVSIRNGRAADFCAAARPSFLFIRQELICGECRNGGEKDVALRTHAGLDVRQHPVPPGSGEGRRPRPGPSGRRGACRPPPATSAGVRPKRSMIASSGQGWGLRRSGGCSAPRIRSGSGTPASS